ncbi:MAG: hypothetical protein J5786_00995 [Clostridiales bacterium]|nr:hypothetical protein [Clostridiales bacterium]
MFKTIKPAELLTVNGGGYFRPIYNKDGIIIGMIWTDKPIIRPNPNPKY